MSKDNRTNKEKRILTYLACGIFFLLGGISNFCFTYLSSTTTKDTEDAYPIRKISTNKLIAPLLLSADSETFYKDDSFSHSISSYINSKKNDGTATDISFYFKNLTSGTWTGVNENERYAPASLMKVPIMIAVFKQAESNPELLKKKMIYSSETDMNQEEYYQPEKRIEKGHSYTVEELIDYMITYSDNNATVLLLSITPQKDLTEIFTDLGLPVPENTTTGTVDYLSTKLYARLFRVLYSSTYLHEEYSAKALSILTNPDFPNGIIKEEPKDILVANKFGERTVYDQNKNPEYRELHDCGIVYIPNNPYLICIMTKGSDFKKLEGIIQDISTIAYKKMIQK
jgi:beta-lactamase class A